MFAFSAAELHIPGARSLKQKRSVMRQLTDRIHHRYRVSIAEIGHHDLLQRSRIGVALVHRDAEQIDRTLTRIEEILASHPEARLVSWSPELFDEDVP